MILEASPCKVSLWLLPPKPAFTKLHEQIQELARINGTPTFIPHVTVVGGIAVNYAEDGLRLLESLKQEFCNFGEIPCTFNELYKGQRNVLAMHENDQSHSQKILASQEKEQQEPNHQPQQEEQQKQIKWNQACISVMDQSPEFMDAFHCALAIMNTFQVRSLPAATADQPIEEIDTSEEKGNKSLDSEQFSFPSPIHEPHFSFAYGNQNNFPSFVDKPPPTFQATQMALFITNPSNLEGVEQWSQIGDAISLV
mmetsp:Transcript_8228/g.10767  ORF Transcript_8228/g.10767 Transcript_8228/m.10767 type:complete len:254 (-) Transcript_8228:556-1317(-)|eukprot:CAMPEP_0198140274 /NCGR_PEP_ID=MMETSP1443-20131203/3463_1 /TAXON_ID=186043 /ORGANISM="Entomoneis sp., Strain CCMP2396" /LENGTH=253 /DNA_ID=CAMNT_0043802647 /DNA_START=41 /DNA_END=802 /DNA_ORIENTATION=+